MKFSIRFQRRYSVFITLAACAASVVMMVRNFGLPQEEVLKYAWICFLLLAVTLLVAAPVALVARWVASRGDGDEKRSPGEEKR